MITTSNNSSHILKKDVSDIFEQIKKKAEDISTSEGSFHLFQNLSNPTNLTNPQIVSFRRIPRIDKGNQDDSKNKTKNKSRNEIPKLKRVKSEMSELHDEFLISEQVKKLLLKKEPKIIFDKCRKMNRDIPIKNKNLEKDKYETIEPIKNEGDIWTRLKNINYIPKDEKEIRVNKRKNVSAREYLSNTKDIQMMKYINKNKVQRLIMLQNIKNKELSSINHTLLSLENSKDFIITNYREKYASYISFLKKQKDQEEKNNFDLYLTKEKLKKEISHLQFKCNKLKKEKMFLINISLLFIQIKEKMRKVPEKAFLFFDKDSHFIKGQKRIMKKPKTVLTKSTKIEDINRIMKYKGKIIYNDIFEFEYDYKQIEDVICNKFKQSQKLKLEIEELKEEYNKIKEYVESDPYAEDKNQCNIILNKLKAKNEELKQEIIALKIKFSDERHNILTKKKHILKHSLSSLSLKSNNHLGTYDNNNSNNNKNNGNIYFNNTNKYSDTYSTIYGFKNIYTLSNFNFNKMRDVSDLYMSCFTLYKTSKDNLFDEIEINFDVEKNMKSPTINEDLVIIKMLEYIDQVATLLIIQRSNYLSKDNLRKKYEKIRNILETDKRRMKIINNFKEEEKKQMLKIKELELKNNKVHYIPKKKIESKYYFRAQKEHSIKLKELAELRRPSTFEDFMYDILV